MEDCTIIIPTLNEEENIGKLLDILSADYPQSKIIVADDGSSDRTQDIVMGHQNKNITLLDRSEEKIKGITASVLDATRLVDTKNMIIMDADLQHPPEKIKDIAKELLFSDIAVAYRQSVADKWPMHRKIMSWGGGALACTRLMLKPFICLDTMSGFFGIKTEMMKSIMAESEDKFIKEGYKVLFDMLKYAPDDIKIGHVGYIFGERMKGGSKIGMKHIYHHLRSIFS